MFSILSTNTKISKVEKVHFVSIHKLATVSKIGLNGIENHGICGVRIANQNQRGWLLENQKESPIFQLKMADSANPYKPQNR